MANYTQSGYDPSIHGYWRGTIDGAPNYGYPENYYYADTMRSIFIAFANFFNDVKVVRYNNALEPVKIITVPIKFGPRQKSHDFRTEQESGKKYYISMPNLTYRLDSMEFASDRAKGIYEQRMFYTDKLEEAGLTCDQQEMFWSDVQPVPYNIGVTMEANCEKMSDAEQIAEQIAVRFQPACFMDLKEFWFFNKRRSIKMKLGSLSWDIQSESMGEEDWRQIKITFSFTIEAFLYKPIRDAQIIEKINTYLTLNKGDYLYHGVTFGNKDGTLETPYDFSKIYGARVGHSYVLSGNPVTTYDPETSAYTTIYEYSETEDLTIYEEGSKLLKKVVSRWIPSGMSAKGPKILHERPLYGLDVHGEPIVTGYAPRYLDPEDTSTGFNPWVCSDIYTGEWLTEKEYIDMSGFGHNDDASISFGDKTLIDKNGSAYSAYYSQYNEEGTFTKTSADFLSGDYDFYYNTSAGRLKFKTDFSGGRYF